MQKKWLSILCITVLMSSVLIGCSNISKEPGRYYNKSKCFSIKFPEGWKKQKSPMGITITFGNPESTAKIGVQKQKIAQQQTLTACVKYMESLIRRSNGKIIDKGETVIDDNDAFWILSKIGQESVLTYYMKKENYIYSIIATAQENDFFENEIREAAESFLFEK